MVQKKSPSANPTGKETQDVQNKTLPSFQPNLLFPPGHSSITTGSSTSLKPGKRQTPPSPTRFLCTQLAAVSHQVFLLNTPSSVSFLPLSLRQPPIASLWPCPCPHCSLCTVYTKNMAISLKHKAGPIIWPSGSRREWRCLLENIWETRGWHD